MKFLLSEKEKKERKKENNLLSFRLYNSQILDYSLHQGIDFLVFWLCIIQFLSQGKQF